MRIIESSEAADIHTVASPCHLTSCCTLGEQTIRLFFTLTAVIKLKVMAMDSDIDRVNGKVTNSIFISKWCDYWGSY